MREQLLQELLVFMDSQGVSLDMARPKLTLILDEYEVEKQNTEIVEYTNDEFNQRIIGLFLINKTVAGLTEKTIEHYKLVLTNIFFRIGKPANLITSDDLKFYIATRQVKDRVTNTTVGNEWHVLSSFYTWMTAEEHIIKNPMLRVECPKQRKQKKKAFSDMEVELLRNNCDSLREKALFEVFLSTWCRVSEIVQMDIADINGSEMIVMGKGHKERIVYLNPRAQLAINNYLATRTDNSPALFVGTKAPFDRLTKAGIEMAMRRLGKRANIDDVHPHRFRRTGATNALKRGMRIETVSHILGHESIRTTQIYLDIDENVAREAHMKYVA